MHLVHHEGGAGVGQREVILQLQEQPVHLGERGLEGALALAPRGLLRQEVGGSHIGARHVAPRVEGVQPGA